MERCSDGWSNECLNGSLEEENRGTDILADTWMGTEPDN